MSIANKDQLQEIASFIGESITVPQVVSHYDKANVYSTTEQKVGIWIDGKPIYKKTIDCGTMPNTSQKRVPINISNLDRVVWHDATIRGSANKYFGILPWLKEDTSIVDSIYIDETAGMIVLGTKSDRTAFDQTYVTLYYTKTTDSAVDYTIEDTDYYSLSETLIGKWFDGKDLFQRTFSFTTGSAQGETTVATLASNIRVKDMQGCVQWATNSCIPICYISNVQQQFFACMYVDQRRLCASIHDADLVSKPAWITIKYTKS